MTVLNSLISDLLFYNSSDNIGEVRNYDSTVTSNEPYDGGGGIFHWILNAEIPSWILTHKPQGRGFFYDSDSSLTFGPHQNGTGIRKLFTVHQLM